MSDGEFQLQPTPCRSEYEDEIHSKVWKKKDEWNMLELVKDNTVEFDSFRQNYFYYKILDKSSSESYLFPVPLEDIGTATLLHKDKAISFMRWIRRAISDKTFIKI